MSNPDTIQRVSVAGIGGFASAHHAALRELENEGRLRVVSACDPRADELSELRNRFAFTERQIDVELDFPKMLEKSKSDWVSIATPIGLHASMHAACVSRGIPCYLEKPPTLNPVELEKMIEVDAMAIVQTQVGFNYVYEPERLLLKKRLLAGEFGRLISVGLRGAWQRTEAYYARSSWAGRLKVGETLVLDSCLGNAMAHHVHNMLFFAGIRDLYSWSDCLNVEAQLFRANPIEGADTVFLKAELGDSIEFRVALTHACSETQFTEETLVCEDALIRITPREGIRIYKRGILEEFIPLAPKNFLKENLRHFGEYVKGKAVRLMSNLSDCRPFVRLNALAYVSAGRIECISPRLIEHYHKPDTGVRGWRIHEIEGRLERFVESGDFSFTQGLSPGGFDYARSSSDELKEFDVTFLARIAARRASVPSEVSLERI